MGSKVSLIQARSIGIRSSVVDSLLASEGRFIRTADVPAWIAERRTRQQCRVTQVPLSALPNWHFHPGTGDLVHSSGRFFRVQGLRGHTDYPEPAVFNQPVISQPEIGILGLLAKSFDGILYFLLQAKMEAGNVTLVQLAPTVQATRSNYTQVHGGTRPRYLEYFTERSRGRALTDQLQSEHGLFFLRKRNRNMIVVTEQDVPLHDDYRWLTLGQIRQLLEHDNLVNMDARTVISAIPLVAKIQDAAGWGLRNDSSPDTFDEAVRASSVLTSGVHTIEEIMGWLTEIRATVEVVADPVALSSLVGWTYDGVDIRRDDAQYFSVVGVTAEANSREVPTWAQPLVKPASRGVNAFLTKRIRGALHLLVQARMEPGLWNQVELAPTIQYLPGSVTPEDQEGPRYSDLIDELNGEAIRHSSIKSDEGGRFLYYQNRNLILEAPPDDDVDVPFTYRWMTLGQLNTLMRYGSYLNVEARSLLACLALRVR